MTTAMTTPTPSSASNETDTATPADVDAAVIAACVERLKFNADPLFRELVRIAQRAVSFEPSDVCGFCDQVGADKVPHPVRWPGEESAGTPYVHEACEDAETHRAFSMLSDRQREEFLRTC